MRMTELFEMLVSWEKRLADFLDRSKHIYPLYTALLSDSR